MKVLFACEESQTGCIEFRKRGHEAYSCDILPCSGGHPEWHIKDDAIATLKGGMLVTQSGQLVYIQQWDLIIAHPPCTYLTVSANKWLKDQPARKSGALVGEARRHAQKESIAFFKRFWYIDIPMICIENPIGIMSTAWQKPTQIIQPWQFGHGETKATCLWLKGLPKLQHTNIVEAREQRIWKMPPSADRSKLRSKTYKGIAVAMAEQWGNLEHVKTINQLSLL